MGSRTKAILDAILSPAMYAGKYSRALRKEARFRMKLTTGQ
jgi:hypothetical protein